MEWLVPLFVFLLAYVFWRLSWQADDRVAAFGRFAVAVVLVLIGLSVSAGIVLK